MARNKKNMKVIQSKKKAPVKRKIASRKPKKKVAKKGIAKRKKKVSAIPSGYSSITPYLIVEEALKAIDFYKNVFGARVMMLMDKPDQTIAHAELKIGDAKIMLADEWPDRGAKSPQSVGGTPVNMHLYVKNVDEVVDKAIARGATLLRAIENMFYGDRAGFIQDPFGHQWFVSTHIEDISPAKVKKRAKELYG